MERPKFGACPLTLCVRWGDGCVCVEGMCVCVCAEAFNPRSNRLLRYNLHPEPSWMKNDTEEGINWIDCVVFTWESFSMQAVRGWPSYHLIGKVETSDTHTHINTCTHAFTHPHTHAAPPFSWGVSGSRKIKPQHFILWKTMLRLGQL